MAISAKLVKELRERTGLGMMECKKALVETDGDIDAAIDLLRKVGAVKREKKADRAQNEGMIILAKSGNRTALLEFCSETDFVCRNPEVIEFCDRVAQAVAENAPADNDALAALSVGESTVSDSLNELIGRIGENLSFGRFKVFEDGIVGQYVHHDKKSAALVKLTGEVSSDLADEIAMHCVFAQPKYLSRDQVPAEDLEREQAIILDQLKQDPKMQDKPEEILKKISAGKLNAFYSESVLPDQQYFKESKSTVSQYLKANAPSASIEDFVLIKVG